MSSPSSSTRRDQLLEQYLAAQQAARPTWTPFRRRIFNRMLMGVANPREWTDQELETGIRLVARLEPAPRRAHG